MPVAARATPSGLSVGRVSRSLQIPKSRPPAGVLDQDAVHERVGPELEGLEVPGVPEVSDERGLTGAVPGVVRLDADPRRPR